MGRQNRRKKPRRPFFDDLTPAARQGIAAVMFGVLSTFFVLASLGYAGRAGELTHRALVYLFGYGFFLAPIAGLMYVAILLRPREDGLASISKMIGVSALFFSSLAFFSLLVEEGGGMVGWALKSPLTYLFGDIATGLTLGGLMMIAMVLIFNIGFTFPFRKKEFQEADQEEDKVEIILPEEVSGEGVDEEVAGEESREKKTIREKIGFSTPSADFIVSSFSGMYDPPPLSLLERDRGKARTGDVKASANLIKHTLQKFGIEVEMDEVSIGPSVTRYALKPAEGVRIAKIVGLQQNLELRLAAHPIRIEAPIPGKSLVGIEVPNTSKAVVGLASLLATPEYTDSPKPLLVALGRDIAGSAHFANLAKMPHLLIAGTTGSGKSVTIHALITSLLFRNSPDQLRFIMVDPKRVELTLYNGIPHLLTGVVTDAKKTIVALKWTAKEMERRYDVLQAEKVRDIDSYHSNVYLPAKKKQESENRKDDEEVDMPEPMPHIVVIIDELADIMSLYPRELEAVIVRLAQMSRAVGIHLVLSTQRPEVKVITGLIKANVPSRIALKVASQIDSRTIIDQPGAEKLLGFGDMLFVSNEQSKPTRLQSAFISETELKKVTDYLKKQANAEMLDTINFEKVEEKGSDVFMGMALDEDEADDELYEDAKQVVTSAGKASTSFLQRRLGIGYSRAARLIDILEERGVIGPGQGAKPREILVGKVEREGKERDDVPIDS